MNRQLLTGRIAVAHPAVTDKRTFIFSSANHTFDGIAVGLVFMGKGKAYGGRDDGPSA
jgi:hypothetical protein